MSKIKLLVEVEEEILNGCKEAYSEGRVPREHNAFRKAIANGTPITEGDLISREALKKAIEEVEDNYDGYEPNDLGKFISKVDELIDNAPTVEYPFYAEAYQTGYEEGKNDRPQGEWIIVKDEKYGDNVKCPFCGKELAGTDLNFCVKCGADMRGDAE